jgi:hypothetical protein
MVRPVGEWRWSNYRATPGPAVTPGFLDVGWTLEQFGTEAGRTLEGYRRFAAAGNPTRGSRRGRARNRTGSQAEAKERRVSVSPSPSILCR